MHLTPFARKATLSRGRDAKTSPPLGGGRYAERSVEIERRFSLGKRERLGRRPVKAGAACATEGRKSADDIEKMLASFGVTPIEAEARGIPISCEDTLTVLGTVGSEVTERNGAEEVRRQRDFYETLLKAQNDVGEGLVVVQGERMRYANKAFCLMSGYSMEELKALASYSELIAEDQRFVLDDWVLRRLRGGDEEDRCETTIIHKSGRQVELEVGVRPLWIEGQRPQLVAVVRDITIRKQVNEKLQSSLGMLVAVHEAGRVLSSSLDPGEIGERLLELMHRVAHIDAAILRLREKCGRLSVVSTCGSDGFLRWVSAAPKSHAARIGALKTGNCRRPFRLTQPKGDGTPVMGSCLPLVVRERVVGVLEAYGTEALAQEMTIETLQNLARQAASALENAQLYQELAERERRLKDLVGRLMGAKEEERRRVAYEVHDGLTQVAIAAHQHLQAFAKSYLPDSASNQTKLDNTLELARQTVREARSVIADLRPTALEDFGLTAALRSKVEALRTEGWEIAYDEALGGECLPAEVERAFYRVAQEALVNVRKHAQTNRARITLACRADSVCLVVRDWGQGFEQSVGPKVNGCGEQVGIYGMRDRITSLGGNFTIYSRPGAGTRVVAEVPLQASEEVTR